MDNCFLVGYVLIILGETVLFRTSYYGEHFQPHIFWSYKVWDVQKRQIFANILMFIPLGLVAGNLWKWKGILAGLVVSVSAELLQLLTERGLYEFDDILHNTLGTTIGVPYLEEHIDQKRAIYERYKEGLKDLPVKMNPYDEKNSVPNFWLSCMIIDDDAMCKTVKG